MNNTEPAFRETRVTGSAPFVAVPRTGSTCPSRGTYSKSSSTEAPGTLTRRSITPGLIKAILGMETRNLDITLTLKAGLEPSKKTASPQCVL